MRLSIVWYSRNPNLKAAVQNLTTKLLTGAGTMEDPGDTLARLFPIVANCVYKTILIIVLTVLKILEAR